MSLPKVSSPMQQKPTALILAIAASLPELLFAILPLLVLTFVLVYAGKSSHHIFASAEWSFASSVLFGQCIVRFVSGASRSGRANIESVGMVVSSVLVFGLVPALVVLALVLHAHEASHSGPPEWLVAIQVAIFCFSILTFVWFGGMGSLWLRSANEG